jgi:hypothetical protein
MIRWWYGGPSYEVCAVLISDELTEGYKAWLGGDTPGGLRLYGTMASTFSCPFRLRNMGTLLSRHTQYVQRR